MPPPCPPVLQKLVVLLVCGEESDVVKGTAAVVLARLLLHNSSFFAHFISSPPMAALLHGKPGTPLLLYVDEWLDKVKQPLLICIDHGCVGVCCSLWLPMPRTGGQMDSVAQVAKRKLSALALCVLLTMREAQLLDRLEAIIR